MIHLDDDAPVPGYPRHKVLQGGNYQEDELVPVYNVANPGVAEIAFRAAYIVGQE